MIVSTWHERIPLSATRHFSPLVLDYVSRSSRLLPWVSHFPSPQAMEKAIEAKQQHPLLREVLVTELHKQYLNMPDSDLANKQIDSLRNENTFSVCTAHQPLLFTGPLYFIYKTVHALVLAKKLSAQFPNKHFVPIFYMGSEDHDLDEIGHCRIQNENLVWETSQQGACGRMKTTHMEEVISAYSKYWNEAVPCEKAWLEVIHSAYDGQRTLAQATQYILHHLFGAKGLVVLDADTAELKKLFVPVMEQELFGKSSSQQLKPSLDALQTHYTLQASPRPINLFYLNEEGRYRIEKNENGWGAVGTSLQWNEATLRKELVDFPDRFSPNVILRPLYQETILPNIAFIGGGGELAYWIPLKVLFDGFKVPFPTLFLRNSLLYVTSSQKQALLNKQISTNNLFMLPDEWYNVLVAEQPWIKKWQETASQIQTMLANYQHDASNLSPDYQESFAAHRAKVQRILNRVTQKTKAHLKRHDDLQWHGFVSLQNKLFPEGQLQERYEHGLMLMKALGDTWLDVLMNVQDPYSDQFTLFGEHPKED